MAKTKISKVAKDLNVALTTVVEFLRKKGITIDDNPNARIEDDVLEILVKEFKSDKDLKNKSDQFYSERQKEKAKVASDIHKPIEEIVIPIEPINKPKVVDKIDVEGIKKSAEESKRVTKKEETEKKPITEAKKETSPSDKYPKEKDKKEQSKKPTKSVESQKDINEISETKHPVSASALEKEADMEKDLAATIKQETGSTASEEKPTEEIFTAGHIPNAPSINVVGKIDLSSINQQTRPKKKTKEEKRSEHQANSWVAQNNNVGGKADASSGDRKKRKRIIGGKEKIDIEKTSIQQPEKVSMRNDRQHREKGSNKEQRAKRPVHTEINEEDVQKQVRETLARLTSKEKGLKKGAKWRKEKREAFASREREAAEGEQAASKVLKLTEFVTANDLAVMMNVPINDVIATCMSLGVIVSINQRLDAETINIVADEFGYKTEYVSAEVVEAILQEDDKDEDLSTRPPIVTVMGHVDHGKTSLLDYIRNANVIAGEAGGITQHIGAYNVKLPDGRRITFLDTPGHEAFTAMRARGAKVTDLCIIIVAADDNVMPQTVEAINHASAAGVPIVFAINKIDKPTANPEKIKEELANMNYLVEDWGGKYQSQDISAKKGTGVTELMEKVLLEAEMLDLKANPNRNAVGSVIESSLDKGRGYVATVLVQNGTLHVGDTILAGTHHGKIKAMFNERNQRIKEAGPATPALILGLNGAPTAGDTFNVMDTEQEAREIATKREQLQRELGLRTKKILTLEDIGRRRAIGNFQELNVVVKGDVDGSIEALSDALINLSTEEIQVNVLHKAVGEISESDVSLAAASDAVIIGFQVRPSLSARRIAEREGVQIRMYSVIYQAIEEVKDAMVGMLAPEIKEEITGTAEVRQTYRISKVGTIAGAVVREGKIKRLCKVRLIRNGIVIYTGDLGSLKRFKDDVKEVVSGYECGLNIAGYNDIKEGDIIEGYEEVEINREL